MIFPAVMIILGVFFLTVGAVEACIDRYGTKP